MIVLLLVRDVMAERVTRVDHSERSDDLTSDDEEETEVADPLSATDEGEEVEGRRGRRGEVARFEDVFEDSNEVGDVVGVAVVEEEGCEDRRKVVELGRREKERELRLNSQSTLTLLGFQSEVTMYSHM